MIKLATTLAFSLVAILVFVAGPAAACSCTEPPSVAEELASSANVFTGRVSGVESLPDEHTQRISLVVYAVWKGESPRTIVIDTPFDGAQCGYHFVLGAEYLVYTEAGVDFPWTHLCSRTRSLSLAEADLAELGSPVVVGIGDWSFGMAKAAYED